VFILNKSRENKIGNPPISPFKKGGVDFWELYKTKGHENLKKEGNKFPSFLKRGEGRLPK